MYCKHSFAILLTSVTYFTLHINTKLLKHSNVFDFSFNNDMLNLKFYIFQTVLRHTFSQPIHSKTIYKRKPFEHLFGVFSRFFFLFFPMQTLWAIRVLFVTNHLHAVKCNIALYCFIILRSCVRCTAVRLNVYLRKGIDRPFRVHCPSRRKTRSAKQRRLNRSVCRFSSLGPVQMFILAGPGNSCDCAVHFIKNRSVRRLNSAEVFFPPATFLLFLRAKTKDTRPTNATRIALVSAPSTWSAVSFQYNTYCNRPVSPKTPVSRSLASGPKKTILSLPHRHKRDGVKFW